MNIFDLPWWQQAWGYAIVANYILMMGLTWFRHGELERTATGECETP
jgi:hypothetical protein